MFNQFYTVGNLYKIICNDGDEMVMVYWGKPYKHHLFKSWENGKPVGSASALHEPSIKAIVPFDGE